MTRRLGARPTLHLAPPTGWLNDPNGLCLHDSTWHVFHQWNPDADVWGPMHWGHATSRDLATWEHHGVALSPDGTGTAYSGSVVIDHDDTAGFGRGAWIAVHTRHSDHAEVQCLAVSTDGAARWAMAPGGAVLTSDHVDFRDPKVLWWRDHWVMVLAVGDHCEVHTSPDLRSWTLTDEVPMPTASTAWECPDLVTVGDGHALIACTSSLDGSGGTIAIPGGFDGERFVSSGPAERLDHGPDFYAWQSVHGVDDRVVGLAWLNSWATATQHASTGWRGMLTVPRELTAGRATAVRSWPASEVVDHPCVHHGVRRLELVGDSGNRATATLDAGWLVVERVVPGVSDLSTTVSVPIGTASPSCIVADAGSLEVFADGGEVSVTMALPADDGWTVTTDS